MEPSVIHIAIGGDPSAIPSSDPPPRQVLAPWWRRTPFRRLVPAGVRSRLWYRDLDRQIREALRERDFDRVYELREELRHARRDDAESSAIRETQWLLDKAGQFYVQTPPVWLDDACQMRSPYWTEQYQGAPRQMTHQGMEWARARIRRELRWRQQQRLHLVTVIS